MAEMINTNSTKKKMKKKKVKPSQQKHKVFLATDPRLAVLMWGVNHSISHLSHIPTRVMLLNDDFKAFGKIRVDNHLYNEGNMPAHFKVKEYMPLVFRNLRRRFNVDEKLFASSFVIQPQGKNQTGNSGAKFYFTDNNLFMIKTMESEEVETMHDIMPLYYQYIVESHKETLLPQYLAMYRTTVDAKEYYYIVLRTLFNPDKTIHVKYDLKGSRVDRDAKEVEKEQETPTLKDNDFTNNNAKICVSADTKTELIEKINKDADFLSSLKIMDYSLLVGIHDIELASASVKYLTLNECTTDEESGDGIEEQSNEMNETETSSPNETDAPSAFAVYSNDGTKKEIYYMGIIDVLSYYSTTRKAAHAAKTMKHGVGAEISTVKPQFYASRFKEFISTIFQ